MMGENGPYKVQEDLSLKLNPNSWNNNATVLWIDQPAGSGFSYGSFITNEDEMASDMWEFLTSFMQQYKAQGRDYSQLPFHVIGESYAGHYVPALSAKIVRESSASNATFKLNYVGSAIGNGLVDPQVQFGQYANYLDEYNGVGPKGQIVKPAAIGLMRALDPVCTGLAAGCNAANATGAVKWTSCLMAYITCAYSQLMPMEFSGINLYDVREECKVPPLCYNFTLITDYLHQPSVMAALGTTGHPWSDCNRLVDMVMVYAGDWMLNFQNDVEYVLDQGHRMLIYAGEYDFICNWMGNDAWTRTFEWNGKAAFGAAANKTWTNGATGHAAGSFRAASGTGTGSLTFLKVFNAGHMVPRDQPENALDMVNRHLFNLPFDKVE